MFAVFAADQQYHHDARVREQERVILAAIRERAAVPPVPVRAVRLRSVSVAPVRPQRAAWPRPIGLHAQCEPVAGCALA